MDSEQLLHHYVSDSLLTTLVPFHEFKQLLRPHTSDEQQLRRWYGLLEDRDAQAVAALQDRIKQFFVGLRSRLLRVLETDQQAHSVNLETLIDTLYKINDVLLQRLQVLDSAIHENTLALAQFEEIADHR